MPDIKATKGKAVKLPAKKAKRVGRPKYVPTAATEEQVEKLAGLGIPLDKIALIVNLSRHTLEDNYREAIDRGNAKTLNLVTQRLFDIAMGSSKESLSACIFWLKCRAGWKPPAEVEVNIDNSQKAVVVNLPPEQEQALARVIEDARERVKRIP